MNTPVSTSHEPGEAHTRFQFGLRTLLLWVAALAALFAVLGRVGPVWQAVIVWLLVLVAAHVSGNFRGSLAGRRRATQAPDHGEQHSQHRPSPGPPWFAPTSWLRNTARLGRPPLPGKLKG